MMMTIPMPLIFHQVQLHRQIFVLSHVYLDCDLHFVCFRVFDFVNCSFRSLSLFSLHSSFFCTVKTNKKHIVSISKTMTTTIITNNHLKNRSNLLFLSPKLEQIFLLDACANIHIDVRL